jgi:hypothetical protein
MIRDIKTEVASLPPSGRALFLAFGFARRVGQPVYMYRTPKGFCFDVASPVMGERWVAQPDGKFLHISGPVT